MDQIRITETTEADLTALQDVIAGAGLFPAEMLPELYRAGTEAGHIWLTAHLANVPVGCCYARPEEMTDGTWNMLALAVSSGHRGQGIGRHLVVGLEQRLSDAGQRLLLVDTSGDPAFSGARAFYERVGYDRAAEIPDYWAAGDAKITFARYLA